MKDGSDIFAAGVDTMAGAPTGVPSIDQLDLGPIMVKLTDQNGENWSKDQALEAEKWYKRFLALNLKYPNQSIVPNDIIDEFWHYHILDTMKYAEDCETVFGSFLHHFPYFGMRGPEDEANLESAFDETKALFENEFGESLGELLVAFGQGFTGESTACEGTECGGTACGSTNCDGNISTERPALAS